MEVNELSARLKTLLEQSLDPTVWEIHSDVEKITIKHRKKEDAGFHLSLRAILMKLAEGEEDQVINQVVNKMVQMAQASDKEKKIKGHTHEVFPVLRSNSHPTEKNGITYLSEKHTVESVIFYALDLGNTYTLIHQQLLEESGYTKEDIQRFAIENIKRLDNSYKEDMVAGNKFYFFSKPDGYAASRILNKELMAFMHRKVEKEMGIAIPHQDVLIVAEIQNDAGFQILAKMTMDFCVKGDIPISPLPFVYADNGELDPIMIVSNSGTPKFKRK